MFVGGFAEYGQAYPHVLNNNSHRSPRGIPEIEISESYLTAQQEEEINKKRNKGGKRKIPFLQKKKKNQLPKVLSGSRETLGGEVGYDDDDDDDGMSDITTYEEGIPVAFEGLKINNDDADEDEDSSNTNIKLFTYHPNPCERFYQKSSDKLLDQ